MPNAKYGKNQGNVKSSIKKVKGADMNVPAEKLEFIQKSSVKMDHGPVKMYKDSAIKMYDKSPTKMKSYLKMNKYDKDMMHERELIYDAKQEIHKEDMAKKHHDHVVSRIAGRKSRM